MYGQVVRFLILQRYIQEAVFSKKSFLGGIHYAENQTNTYMRSPRAGRPLAAKLLTISGEGATVLRRGICFNAK